VSFKDIFGHSLGVKLKTAEYKQILQGQTMQSPLHAPLKVEAVPTGNQKEARG
jgi:hypothetical protein